MKCLEVFSADHFNNSESLEKQQISFQIAFLKEFVETVKNQFLAKTTCLKQPARYFS